MTLRHRRAPAVFWSIQNRLPLVAAPGPAGRAPSPAKPGLSLRIGGKRNVSRKPADDNIAALVPSPGPVPMVKHPFQGPGMLGVYRTEETVDVGLRTRLALSLADRSRLADPSRRDLAGAG